MARPEKRGEPEGRAAGDWAGVDSRSESEVIDLLRDFGPGALILRVWVLRPKSVWYWSGSWMRQKRSGRVHVSCLCGLLPSRAVCWTDAGGLHWDENV